MANGTVKLELSGAEAQIALDHGYPFEEIEAPLAQIAGRRGTFVLELDRFSLEHLAADLSRSSREVEDRKGKYRYRKGVREHPSSHRERGTSPLVNEFNGVGVLDPWPVTDVSPGSGPAFCESGRLAP